jgi:MarR family transcriptional regulator, organic hydroperoxide resistance regulator
MDEQPGPATALDTGSAVDTGTTLDTGSAYAGRILDAERVPHAEPLNAGPRYVAGPDPAAGDDELNQQIADALTELIKQAHELGHGIASDFGLTGSDAKALFLLGSPMTMKELGQRLGCDPSFVTSVADALEKHGLARREPSQRDRRSKNIVLTAAGVQVRDRICGELSTRAPWCTTLDTGERQCLLYLVRKMLRFRGGR